MITYKLANITRGLANMCLKLANITCSLANMCLKLTNMTLKLANIFSSYLINEETHTISCESLILLQRIV